DDVLVYERPDQKEWEFDGKVTEDGRYLIITVLKGTDAKNRILYKDLTAEDAKPVELIGHFDDEYTFINNDGPRFWFKTNRDAPPGKVVAIDIHQPTRERWKEVIPQAGETLQAANIVGDRFFATYPKDAHTQVKVFDLDGTFLRDVEFPGLGTASGFGGKRTD